MVDTPPNAPAAPATPRRPGAAWMLAHPARRLAQLGAFALFRYFDAAKPGPVGWADGLFKARGQPIGWAQGWGILFDDLVAAACTLVVLAAGWRVWLELGR